MNSANAHLYSGVITVIIVPVSEFNFLSERVVVIISNWNSCLYVCKLQR